MKNLRKVLVFVLFALATVLAFGMNGVKAAEVLAYSTGFESSESFKASTTYNNTTLKVDGKSGEQWATFYGTPSTTGALKGTQSLQMRYYTTAPSNIPYSMMKFDIANLTKVEFYASNTSGNNVSVSYSTDGGTTWTGAQTFTLSSSAKVYTYIVSETGEYDNVRLKFTLAVPASPANKSRLTIDDVKIYQAVSSSLEELVAPTVSVNEKVASWEAVEGAVEYKVGLFNSSSAATPSYEYTTEETTYDFTKFVSAGTWFVKVKAIADNVTAVSSIYSTNEATFVNTAATIECSMTEFLTYIDPLKSNTYVLSGTLTAFYNDSYEESQTNTYSSQYGNISFYLSDGTAKVLIFRVSGEKGKSLQVGDKLTVSGKLENYKGVNQMPAGAQYVEIKPLCGVGVQTAEAENGAQHIRFVAGLNVNWEEVETLTFTITDANNAENTRTVNVYKVFGTLVANGEAGVVEVTAESQGFESLFAVTVTNVAAGTTLNVTATFTTASGTYTSVAKTVAVPAAE